MAHPRNRKGKGPSKLISVRLDMEVFLKLKKNHPNYSEYLRDRITYDVMRKHTRKGG